MRIGKVVRFDDNRKYLPVHDVCQIVFVQLCDILPVVHALTESKTMSSMFQSGTRLLTSKGTTEYVGVTDDEATMRGTGQFICDLYMKYN